MLFIHSIIVVHHQRLLRYRILLLVHQIVLLGILDEPRAEEHLALELDKNFLVMEKTMREKPVEAPDQERKVFDRL